MNFFVNRAIGYGNSGVEHAQFYRAAYFNAKHMPFKIVLTDYLPQLHHHLLEWQLSEKNVIGLYDYLLSDRPDEYLRFGLQKINQFEQQVLTDSQGKQRLLNYQSTGQYTAKVYMNSDSNELLHDRVILTNGTHTMKWHYRGTGVQRRMVNIYLTDFYGENYLFRTFEELLAFFYRKLERSFQNNVYIIDRGVASVEALLRLKYETKNFKVMAVVHAQHMVMHEQNHYIWNKHYQYIFDQLPAFDKIIVATQLQKDNILSQLKEMGVEVDGDQFAVIPAGGVNGIPSLKTWDGQVMKFVTVSRLHAEKNIQHIIQSLKIIKQQGLRAELAIYGVGYEEQMLRQVAQDCGLQSCVHFKGLGRHINDELQKYDVFVSASYSEGFGLTYIDAMSSGLPIVSYQNDYGAKTLIQSTMNGMLVPIEQTMSNNITHLAKAMIAVFSNYTILSRGQQQMARCFQNDDIANKWQRVMGDNDDD